jgi:hypothetical protein
VRIASDRCRNAGRPNAGGTGDIYRGQDTSRHLSHELNGLFPRPGRLPIRQCE